MRNMSIKTRKEILEEIWNETLTEVIDSEVKLTLLKTKKPNEIIYSKMERVMGRPMQKDYTTKMAIETEEKNWRGQLEVLGIVKKLLEKC